MVIIQFEYLKKIKDADLKAIVIIRFGKFAENQKMVLIYHKEEKQYQI